MKSSIVIVVFVVLSLMRIPAAYAAPLHVATARARCAGAVSARFPGIAIRYECFAGESRFFLPGITRVGLYLSPAKETIWLDGQAKPYGVGDGEMYIFFSSAADCHFGPGVTLKLSDPCLLILSQAGFASSLPHAYLAAHGYAMVQGYVSGCRFKGGRPLFAMVLLPCKFSPENDHTAGTITFTRWSDRPGGHFAFRFSPDARLTGIFTDKSLATVTVAVPLAGSANGVIH